MTRKRLTQFFPGLIPIRQWQKKQCFYIKSYFDKNKYARTKIAFSFPNTVTETSSLMLNQNSGYDMKFQYNKIYNLKLAAKSINYLTIRPDEVFSFCLATKNADKKEPYREGLVFSDDGIKGAYGGGLCQLSTMLYWLFLHTPLTVVERHGHDVESFPTTTENLPVGTDATISEGWLDLKVKNETANTFQIEICFDEEYMYGKIRAKDPVDSLYRVYNGKIEYYRKGKRVYQEAEVCRLKINPYVNRSDEETLYTNCTEIAYELPDNIEILERMEN